MFTSLRERAGLDPAMVRSGLWTGAGPISRTEAASLGAFQRAPGTLLKATGPAGGSSDTVYEVDETGRLRAYTSPDLFNRSGRNWANIQTLDPVEIARFERGADITSPFTLPTGQSGGALGEPLNTRRGFLEMPGLANAEAERLASLIGFLPSPSRVGMYFNRLLPAEQTALISAYRLAGLPEADVRAMIECTGIRGRARTGIFSG